jgi:multiple sugar transport system substrate-binding protein
VQQEYEGRAARYKAASRTGGIGPSQAQHRDPPRDGRQVWEAFGKTYPNIKVEKQSLNYNEMLNKLRTAALGNAAPMVARLPILWGVEFAAKGQLSPLTPGRCRPQGQRLLAGGDEVGHVARQDLRPADQQRDHGADLERGAVRRGRPRPREAAATWADLVTYSKQIKDKTGKNGYGLVARANAGNTPFRFMPQCWAFGGGALDEAEASPTYQSIYINNDGLEAALQASFDMYVRDRSVPVSALTNTQNENQDPFIAGQLAMMISHPTEYSVMVDRARRATGPDKKTAEAVVENMRYGLIPRARPGARSSSADRTSTCSTRTWSTATWTWTRRAPSSPSRPAPNGRPRSPGSSPTRATCAASGPSG